MRKMTIWFDEEDLVALNRLAEEQLRWPQEQARWMLRQQLRQLELTRQDISDKEVTLVTINDERREVE